MLRFNSLPTLRRGCRISEPQTSGHTWRSSSNLRFRCPKSCRRPECEQTNVCRSSRREDRCTGSSQALSRAPAAALAALLAVQAFLPNAAIADSLAPELPSTSYGSNEIGQLAAQSPPLTEEDLQAQLPPGVELPDEAMSAELQASRRRRPHVWGNIIIHLHGKCVPTKLLPECSHAQRVTRRSACNNRDPCRRKRWPEPHPSVFVYVRVLIWFIIVWVAVVVQPLG